MDTSGHGTVDAVLVLLVLLLFVQTVSRLPRPERLRAKRLRAVALLWPAALLWAAVAVPSLLQTRVGGLYDALHRDPGLIVDHQQWWRVVTAVVVQDGDWSGTVWNLAVLAIVAPLAVRQRGGRACWAVFWGCGAGINVVAAVARFPAGGGNSFATYALACAVVVRAWTAPADRLPRVLAAGVPVAAAALVALRDAHGLAMFVGLAAGLAVDLVGHGRRPVSPGAPARRPGRG